MRLDEMKDDETSEDACAGMYANASESNNKRICYFYDNDYAGMYYGADHPMKPPRIAMTHSLVVGYGLDSKMDVYKPRRAQREELTGFHSEDYINTLRSTTPEAFRHSLPQGTYSKYGLDEDCPIFPGMFDFCRLYSGASIEGAAKLNSGQYDVAINWAGGLHHAKKASSSGFCYVNDCVLAILEMLKYHPRVLYIDIDIHHGDGVEEAFYCTDRVMTLSTHLYRPEWFFPGTGSLKEIGEGQGRGYSVNVPLVEGCTDDDFMFMFQPILERVMDVFKPGAICLQCGADGLVGDRLGTFNMTVQGHAAAVDFVKSFKVPLLVLGGGGYTKTNVARAWTLGTAAIVGEEPDNELPESKYRNFFGPDNSLRYNPPSRFQDLNTKEDLHAILGTILDNLKELYSAPGADLAIHPPDAFIPHANDPGAEEAVHNRLTAYAQSHFAQYLRCVEAGLADPFENF
jgi:histone deacetylase 1/2